MKAAVWHEGRPELLLEDIPEPEMLPESAIIKVEAAFVAGGLLGRLQNPPQMMRPPWPFVPGLDTVGRVIAVADGVNPKVNLKGPKTTEQRPISPHDETTS